MCCVVYLLFLLTRYLLAIVALALLYSLAQALRHAHRMRGGADPVSAASGRLFDFVGDQVTCSELLVCRYTIVCYLVKEIISPDPVGVHEISIPYDWIAAQTEKGKGAV